MVHIYKIVLTSKDTNNNLYKISDNSSDTSPDWANCE